VLLGEIMRNFFLFKTSPNLHDFPPLQQSYTRKDQVILNKLLTVYPLLVLTNSYLLNKEQSPNCDHYRCALTLLENYHCITIVLLRYTMVKL